MGLQRPKVYLHEQETDSRRFHSFDALVSKCRSVCMLLETVGGGSVMKQYLVSPRSLVETEDFRVLTYVCLHVNVCGRRESFP